MALNVGNQKNNFGRKINYLNKDFEQFRQNLIEYSKVYFPDSYSDFSEASPGMLFIEMASYIGDVLSYYIDDTLKESLMYYAEDRSNVIALSNFLGYQPKVITPSVAKLAVFQLVPSKRTTDPTYSDSDKFEPDTKFYLRIKEGMVLQSTNNIKFRTTEVIDFNVTDEREISVYSVDESGNPTQYVVKKYVDVISSELKTITYDFGNSANKFSRIDLSDTNVIDIFDVRDSNGNKWYSVPYLAQETVYIDYPVSETTDKDLLQFKESVPNILKVVRTSKRFTTQINEDNTTSIIFGGGNSTQPDEILIPTFKNVGLGLNSSIDRLSSAFDPANFLKTKTYGESPIGEFTISYLVGGGVDSNVSSGQITEILSIDYEEDLGIFSDEELILYNRSKSSIAVQNETNATGGRGPETTEEIRQNSLANFGSQNRAVTRKDYQVRALSLPPKYGGVAKAYCAPDGELDNNSPSSILANQSHLNEFSQLVISLKDRNISESEIQREISKFLIGKSNNINEKNNPFAVNLYLLGYDSDKKLTTLNRAVKENLKTYMKEHKMLTDGVNLIDGFWINIGVEFDIRVYSNYNKQEVLLMCINEITEYFNIDNWTFNMPINISELELLIASVEGVQSVPRCEITNKCSGNMDGGYSPYSYNIKEATKNKMVYPALDPSIFELKYPNRDIVGRVI